jgi:hypothetical protein
MYSEISKCRICKSDKLDSIFRFGDQYLTGVFPKTTDEIVACGPVELVKCVSEGGCGLVQLKQSFDLEQMYGPNYGYRSGLNESMVRHLQSKVKKILEKGILEHGDLVIDIGSNDCTTLKAYPETTFTLVGIDPTGVKFAGYYPDHVQLIPDFFSGDLITDKFAGKKAKVITSFSMFYDLEDPVKFAVEIESALAEDGVWVFEQSYLPTMLRTNSFDTICHEHLEFYSLKQICFILEKAGLKLLSVEFNEINGGSFSLTAAKLVASHPSEDEKIIAILAEERALGLDGLEVFDQFFSRVVDEKKKLLQLLQALKADGKTIYGLGASTKGNVLLQHYGLSSEFISAIGEVNEEKFGSYTPGSKIPIISEAELLREQPDYLLVLPWHFRPYFLNSAKYKGMKLIFPLPTVEIVEL